MAERAPTPAAPADLPPRRRRARWIALAFGVAALASCWNPIAAPFGLVVGIVAVVLSLRGLRRAGPSRRVEAAALATSVVAVIASAIVIVLTAGSVGIELPGQPVVKGRTAAEVDQVLSGAAERTRPRRGEAARELRSLGGGGGGRDTPPRPASPPAPPGAERRTDTDRERR